MAYEKKHMEMKLLNALGGGIVDREYVAAALDVVWPMIDELQNEVPSLHEDAAGGCI